MKLDYLTEVVILESELKDKIGYVVGFIYDIPFAELYIIRLKDVMYKGYDSIPLTTSQFKIKGE
jgi:hypothetical protein